MLPLSKETIPIALTWTNITEKQAITLK